MVAVGEQNRSPLSVRHWIGLRSIVVADHLQVSPSLLFVRGAQFLLDCAPIRE